VNGQSVFKIVLPENCSPDIRNAVDDLAGYLNKSTGAKALIVPEPLSDVSATKIFFRYGSIDKNLAGTQELGDDGYKILISDNNEIYITGNTDDAIIFGIYGFLETFLGIKWLFPGDTGEIVPRHKSLILKPQSLQSVPAFRSRMLSPLAQDSKVSYIKTQWAWARRNGAGKIIHFHHNLHSVFPPSVYTNTHPEFYPEINGKRYLPASTIGWQPCFSAPDSADEAVSRISEILKSSAQRPFIRNNSFSLAVNDHQGSCECAECNAQNGNVISSLGFPSKSMAYYQWCNEVTKKVLLKNPGITFGLLAYDDVYDPPYGVKLHKSIVPFLCKDRMLWLNKDAEKKDQKRNQEWTKHGAELGWYDYVYGCNFYLIPRVYFRKMDEYIKYAAANNVRHYYAEAYPGEDWLEGPKFFVLLKLLWDPSRNADELVTQWCAAFAGKKAAPDIHAFFSFWEQYWTVKVSGSDWFQKNSGLQFLPPRGVQYLKQLTRDDLQKTGSHLLKALAAAETPEEKKRVENFKAAWNKRIRKIESILDFFELNSKPKSFSTVQKISEDDFSVYKDWSAWQRPYSKGLLRLWPDNRIPGGRGCLQIHGANSFRGPMCFFRVLPIQEGKLYRISVWVKYENLSEGGDIYITLKWMDKDRKWIINRPQGDIPDLETPLGAKPDEVTDWELLQVVFKGPDKDAAHVNIMLSLENTDKGTVWFDDFLFEEVLE